MLSILHFLFGSNQYIDRSALWAGVAVVLATVGVAVAFVQLGGIKKVSRADFAKRFIDTFFSAETRTLFTLLLNSALEFAVLEITDEAGMVIDRLPYFRIKKSVAKQLQGIVAIEEARTGYSAFEIDDLLLGFFDDLGWYYQRGLIDLETIKQAFGYYICESFENDQVKRYLADEDNESKYADFRLLYNEVRKKNQAHDVRDATSATQRVLTIPDFR
jgi:hypothetical protein